MVEVVSRERDVTASTDVEDDLSVRVASVSGSVVVPGDLVEDRSWDGDRVGRGSRIRARKLQSHPLYGGNSVVRNFSEALREESVVGLSVVEVGIKASLNITRSSSDIIKKILSSLEASSNVDVLSLSRVGDSRSIRVDSSGSERQVSSNN